mgnify:FL=1
MIGKIVGGTAKDGKQLKADFNRNVPAFKRLNDELKRAFANKGWLRGIDGRKLFVRSEHRCLSQLLQSSGAILCKQWVKLIDQELIKQDLEAYIMGWIHDEVQIACKTKEVAENVGDICKRMAEEAGRDFVFQIPIEADYGVGTTWTDTH